MPPEAMPPLKVLIVEDDLNMRLGCEQALQLAGLEVLTASSAEQARSAIESGEAGVIVTSYDDEAEGEMAKGSDGKTRITRITLRPKIVFGDVPPTEEMLADLHHKAHEACFIANSITSEIVIEPR